MDRAEVKHLAFIADVSNLQSILRDGILCHVRASQRDHSDIADPEVQEIRARRSVPGGKPLHRYANLYVNARNPMLFRLYKGERRDVVVIAVRAGILDLPNVVVSDRNAGGWGPLFMEADEGIAALRHEQVFQEHWAPWPDNQLTQAEVLVPDRVRPEMIAGVWVPDESTGQRIQPLLDPLVVCV